MAQRTLAILATLLLAAYAAPCPAEDSLPPLTTWQTVTEFSLSPSGAAMKDGKEIKLGGKPWQGPREFRNLRWEMPTPPQK